VCKNAFPLRRVKKGAHPFFDIVGVFQTVPQKGVPIFSSNYLWGGYPIVYFRRPFLWCLHPLFLTWGEGLNFL